MSRAIDELSKDLAGGMSRRKALWRCLVGIGGVLFAGRRASAQHRNDVCVDFCRGQGLTGREFGQCVAASTRCGPNQCAVVQQGNSFCVPIPEQPPK